MSNKMRYSFSLLYKKQNLLILTAFFSIISIILLLSPIPNMQSPIYKPLAVMFNLLSASAGNPFFMTSCAVFALLALSLKLSYKRLFITYLQFLLILVLSFVLKSVLKDVTEVPRPFVEQLVKHEFVESAELFYQKTEEQKNLLVDNASPQFSHYRIKNWYGDSNYSFPSGHTIFVATCVVFWGGLFLRQRAYILASLLVTWATGVAFSRYWLGMHWPADILMSIFCAGLLMLLVPNINHKRTNPTEEKQH